MHICPATKVVPHKLHQVIGKMILYSPNPYTFYAVYNGSNGVSRTSAAHGNKQIHILSIHTTVPRAEPHYVCVPACSFSARHKMRMLQGDLMG